MRTQVDALVRHLNRYSTCAPGKWVQHDLHHGELVQVGVQNDWMIMRAAL